MFQTTNQMWHSCDSCDFTWQIDATNMATEWQVRLCSMSDFLGSSQSSCLQKKSTNVWFQRRVLSFWENGQNVFLWYFSVTRSGKTFFANQLPLFPAQKIIGNLVKTCDKLMNFHNCTTWWNTGGIPNFGENGNNLKERFCSLGYSCKTFVAICTQHGLVITLNQNASSSGTNL